MSMTAEIISVGTELLLGNILNTNAQYLSRELAALGITVRRQSTIGDNQDRLADFVNEAKQRCDLLVFTGGLGPTADDLTKETVAACFGDTLTFDPEEWQKIVDFFTRTGRETTPNNRKQAMVPVHGHKVVNHHGTAPGAWFEQDGRCAVLMPGVPHEMKAMWEESVRPLLLARQSCALHSLTLRVLGGESNLEYRVRALLENPNPTAAIYCKTGECEIRITARAQNDAEAQTMCRAYAKKFYDLLGDAVYDEDVAGLEETVVHTLQANGLTIATAESCTGGMIAQRLTSVSGASEVFGYGFVTYWEQAKAKLVGVDPAVIAQYNVVSAPVAAQMALGAAKAAGADIAVSVTGLAGPGGGDAVRPVGTVYLGAARGDKAYVKKLFVSRPDRALIRARAAQTALELALRLAQGKTPAGTQVLAESAQHDPAALTALDETLRASARQAACCGCSVHRSRPCKRLWKPCRTLGRARCTAAAGVRKHWWRCKAAPRSSCTGRYSSCGQALPWHCTGKGSRPLPLPQCRRWNSTASCWCAVIPPPGRCWRPGWKTFPARKRYSILAL